MNSTTAEEIEKLKVADLRKELKSRGLSMSGNKPELVQRLLDSTAGRSLNNTTAEDDEALEDDVLGISAADSTISGFPLDSAALEDKILGEIPSTPTKTEISPLSSPTKAKLTPLAASVTSTKSTTVTSPSQATVDPTASESEGQDGDDSGKKKITFGTGPVLSAAERAKKFNLAVTELTAEQRKNLRQERFGVKGDSKVAGGEELLNKRAERFNLTKTGTEPIAKNLDAAQQKRQERFAANGETKSLGTQNSTLKLVTPGDEALKKRAERFGMKKDSADKIDTIKKLSEEDRKNKRKEKFDLTTSTVPKDADPEVKRQKRAERFTLRQ